MKEIFPIYSIGHFINQPGNPTEFEIIRFDDMEESEVDDFHKHTFYEIIWTEAGESKQIIDDKEFRISCGSLFFISPGQLHYFEEWQQVKGGSILFTEDFFLLSQQNKDKLFELSFLDNFYGSPSLIPDKKSYHEINHTITLLLDEKRRENYSPSIAQALLHILLLQIQRCIDSQLKEIISKTHIMIYKKFKCLIDVYYREKFTVSDYASKLNITQHHLNHSVKQVAGKTASEAIRARTILEAKRLLTFSNFTITEIATQLGFFDSSYFAKLFKAETNATPVAFRKSVSEKYRIR